jgi:type IV secretory pathway VirB2 component (pilin)
MKKISAFLAKIALFSILTIAALPALTIVSAEAFAQVGSGGTIISANPNSNVLVDTICNVLKIVTGNAGKAFAAFAIISLGIGFFTGKVSWGLMIGIAAGIAAMFGAPSIVAAITGRGAFDCGS